MRLLIKQMCHLETKLLEIDAEIIYAWCGTCTSFHMHIERKFGEKRGNSVLLFANRHKELVSKVPLGTAVVCIKVFLNILLLIL